MPRSKLFFPSGHGASPSPWPLLLAVCFTFASPSAAAQEAALATSAAPCVCEENDPTVHRHDGFFARADVGLAGTWAGVSGSAVGRDRIWGIGQSAGIFIGGTPRRGLVVGGYLWTARIDPTFVVRGVRVSPDDDSVKLTLGRIGPFLDYYPDPLRGFHTQVTVGLAVQVESDTKGNSIKPASVGGAASWGVGYELFVGHQFSVGAMARFTVGALARSPPGAGRERLFVEVPELVLTSTYH